MKVVNNRSSIIINTVYVKVLRTFEIRTRGSSHLVKIGHLNYLRTGEGIVTNSVPFYLIHYTHCTINQYEQFSVLKL